MSDEVQSTSSLKNIFNFLIQHQRIPSETFQLFTNTLDAK